MRQYIALCLSALSKSLWPGSLRAERHKSTLDTPLDRSTANFAEHILIQILSAILLAGLALNATLGWWWADPVAALVMVPIGK
jgi:hypothetical protein